MSDVSEIKARQDFLHALLRAFESPDGAIALQWLHATAGTRSASTQPTTTGSVDPYATHYRDGRKSLVLEIEARLTEARASLRTNPADLKPPKARPGPGSRRKGG